MSIFIIDQKGQSYQSVIEEGEPVEKELCKVLSIKKHKGESIILSGSGKEAYHIKELDKQRVLVLPIDPEQFDEMILNSKRYKDIEEELKSILNSSGELVTIVNSQGVVERVSSNCKKIMGIEMKDFVGKSIFELEGAGIVSLSSTKKVLETLKEVNLTQYTKGNKRLYVQGIPIFNQNGSLEKILNISKDVTEESILREKLKKAEKEVELLVNEVNKRYEDKKLIIKSLKIEKVYYLLNRVAKTDATVLFLGETGVGKGVFARHLHEISDRKKQPFIHINCSVLPEHLIESELFGYVKGSFTGANVQGKKGLIEAADKGTLFLDEIGELPLQTQAKLLQVLQEKSFMPIGRTVPVKVDVRIIAATNQNLESMVEKGTFRSDLFYRLNVVPVSIPPLREREEDIPFLLQHFLTVFNKKYKRSCNFSTDTIDRFTNYEWPGNVRELENIIERLVITSAKSKIEREDLPEQMNEKHQSQRHPNDIGGTLKEKMERFEKEILVEAAKNCDNLSEISQQLKVDVSTVSRKMKKYDVNLQ
ncbi:sigma-54-dependent Fis family transcriptional regulator [Planomicrobium sp. YIM 101495]|uniref:sigma-54 interaction domain-containing protein n=1 Tax=Planomicrobium sp. YIM 101495 TaxID=2665160 RepID=UPI0012B71C55|nr:sigma 54-interacting transcriptional regulator [Planomicrobium sp. YIM 101495]MTD30727.1 AAA domain-containing protein [Planomicrobium sp. YIM 101495]